MACLNRKIFKHFYLLTILGFSSAATTRMPLIAYALPQNITSIQQNCTASLTYITSSLENNTLQTQFSSIPQNAGAASSDIQAGISDALASSSSTFSPTQASSISITLPITSTTQNSTTTVPSPPPPPTSTSPKTCTATCPGEGKVCGSRLGGNCTANTLYSCMNNWDPPLLGDEKDCIMLDGKSGVCEQVKLGFWDTLTGQRKDICVGTRFPGTTRFPRLKPTRLLEARPSPTIISIHKY
jgi:hypothetical protein